MSIGERLHEVRKEKELSQEGFAKALGVSKGAISSYEHGKQMPGALVIMSVYDNFNVEPRWLLKGEGPKYGKAIVTQRDLYDYNVYMEEVDPKIKDLKAEIDRLKQELFITQLERDRAKTEAYKALKAALKAHVPDLDLDANAQN